MPAWVVILVAIIGSGGFTALVSWMLHRIDSRGDLEKAIANSPAIKSIELELYRLELFAPTTDRATHERQLEAGETYVKLGGNGSGHVRYTQLQDDYARRLRDNDWDY